MSRFNVILAALAVLQIILVLVTGGGSEERAAPVEGIGTEPFAGLQAETVGSLEITDDDLQKVVLERAPEPAKKSGDQKDASKDEAAGKDAKGSWVLASKGGFPVRDGEVERSLTTLGKLRIARLLTRKPRNFTSLEISDSNFSRHIVVKARDGRTLGDFYIGDSDRPSTVHYREAGKDIAFDATGISTWDFNSDASSWIESAFTELESKDVVALELQHEGGSYRIQLEERKPAKKEAAPDSKPTTAPAKKPDEPAAEPEKVWVVVKPAPQVGTELDKTKVETLLSGLCRMYLAEPIGKYDAAKNADWGFDNPTARATITLKDGKAHLVTVGAKREKEDDFFAMRTGLDYVVTLRPWSVNEQLKKKLDDLLPEKKTEDGKDK